MHDIRRETDVERGGLDRQQRRPVSDRHPTMLSNPAVVLKYPARDEARGIELHQWKRRMVRELRRRTLILTPDVREATGATYIVEGSEIVVVHKREMSSCGSNTGSTPETDDPSGPRTLVRTSYVR